QTGGGGENVIKHRHPMILSEPITSGPGLAFGLPLSTPSAVGLDFRIPSANLSASSTCSQDVLGIVAIS
ncbi:MAG TPA: hypothetical protein PLK64_12665, partial [Dermatophilaceae bacterium]|nr:hypothetical protein [Dermatophilaceae bacterium]